MKLGFLWLASLALLLSQISICQNYTHTIQGDDTDDFMLRIVGCIRVSNPKHYKWIVSLQNKYGHYCGGSLISKIAILTSAHCQLGYGPPTKIIIGAKSLNKGRIERKAAQVLIHRGHKMGGSNDEVCIIILDEPVTNIEPVQLSNGSGNSEKKTERLMLLDGVP